VDVEAEVEWRCIRVRRRLVDKQCHAGWINRRAIFVAITWLACSILRSRTASKKSNTNLNTSTSQLRDERQQQYGDCIADELCRYLDYEVPLSPPIFEFPPRSYLRIVSCEFVIAVFAGLGRVVS
jgi:hypothetical protein